MNLCHRGSPLDPLTAALEDFQAGLTLQQRAHLRALKSKPDLNAVLVFTTQLDEERAKGNSRGVASRLMDVLQSIQQYSAIMDTFSQVKADITSLVWGSVKLTLLVS